MVNETAPPLLLQRTPAVSVHRSSRPAAVVMVDVIDNLRIDRGAARRRSTAASERLPAAGRLQLRDDPGGVLRPCVAVRCQRPLHPVINPEWWTNVRLGAHSGLRSDIAALPKSADSVENVFFA